MEKNRKSFNGETPVPLPPIDDITKYHAILKCDRCKHMIGLTGTEVAINRTLSTTHRYCQWQGCFGRYKEKHRERYD